MTLLTYFSVSIIPAPAKLDWPSFQKNLLMLSFLLTRRADLPLYLVPCKQWRSFFFRWLSISTTSIPQTLKTFTVGLWPWPEVAQTIKSTIIDATFIQYWGIIVLLNALPDTDSLSVWETRYFYQRDHLTDAHQVN